MLDLTGRIMLVSIIVLLVIVAFIFSLHLYAKWFWYRSDQDLNTTTTTTVRTRRRRRFDFAPGHQELSFITGCGLDQSVLKSIPVVIFSPQDFKDGLECAVCLCEISEGEKTRFLPKCNHGFHVDCIDMWFQSHSTCPLCRNPVSNQSSSKPNTSESTLEEETIIQPPPMAESLGAILYSNESLNFPTNVLFWGNETQVSTLGTTSLEEGQEGGNSSFQPACSSSASNRTGGVLVIDIPRYVNEEEEPKSPVTTRLRSLKRLLSRDRRVSIVSSTSNVDVEQGSRSQI